jgi:uncharacterized protein (DUF58 family)
MASIDPTLFKRIKQIQFYTNKLVDDIFAGAYRSAFKGNGMEFEEVREYQSGDDIRAIDWNVTARTGTPFVKTFREERELTVMLLVDLSKSAYFGTSTRLKRELIAEIAAVLAFSAIKNLDKIGLIIFTDQIELYIPPKRGLAHVLRVVREVLAFKPAHEKTDIGQALSFFAKVTPKTAVCFLFSDFITNKDFSKEMKLIASKHDLISVMITDPREQEMPKMSLVQLRDLETNSVSVVDTNYPRLRESFANQVKKRHDDIKNLSQKMGGGFLELATNQPYSVAIKQYFKQRGKRR